jgi:hypothetical protein
VVGGHIPFESTGHEPEFTSFEQLCVLNAADKDAHLEITLYYADRDPVGPYPLVVGARRVRHVRFNDLIDPEAMPLDVDYAAVVESDVPVVVQFIRQDTRQAENALFSTPAFPIGD